jgi:hypothetical protein
MGSLAGAYRVLLFEVTSGRLTRMPDAATIESAERMVTIH